jgi:hypothetical protein
MILTDRYKFEKKPGTKSKLRIDCTASTKSYPEFEGMRNKAGDLFVYWGDVPDGFGGNVHRKADKAITKVKNISSVYVPDVTTGKSHGDVRGTQDAILIIFNRDQTQIEIFVARGYKNNRVAVYQMLADGELDDEVDALRSKSVTESVTGTPDNENDKTAGNEC